jgi:hypothetical protein
MPIARHVIRGNVARLLKSQFRFILAGNSIHSPSQDYNVTQALFKNAPIPVLGCCVGHLTSYGFPLSGTIVNPGMTLVNKRPGDDLSSGSNGANLRITQVATGNASDFTPTPRMNSVDNASPSGIWNENKTVRATWFLESDAAATGYWVNDTAAWIHYQANRITSASGHPYVQFVINPNLQASPNQLLVRQTPWYANQSGPNTLLGYIQSWNNTESGTLKPLACALETNEPVGVFGGYAGNGSWFLECHATEAGATVTADAPTYTARYSDAALIAEMAALRYNCCILCPGANEPNFAVIKTQILRVMARYRRCASLAGIPPLCFLLVTQYDALSNDTTPWDLARNACIEIALSRPDTECVDFGGFQRDAYGPWSNYNDISGDPQLVDSIHPSRTNSILRDNWANLIYFQANRINTSSGSYAPGGPFFPAWANR